MKKVITVEYPTMETQIISTEAEMRAKGYKSYKGDHVRYNPINRLEQIQVKQVRRLVQEEFMTGADYEAELEDMCKRQTGLTRSQYQSRYKRAWNE